MLRQPFLEQLVRDAHLDDAARVAHQDGGLEPGEERVPVHLRLDPADYLIPDRGGHHG
jgi:hypothetical protein